MSFIQKYAPIILSLLIVIIFVQSLFFKFTYSMETAYIFMTLDNWSAGFGMEGLFVPPGLFNAYVIGAMELLSALLLLLGLVLRRVEILASGALLALGIMTAAILFHLFTPLGIEVLGDGGVLFAMAIGVWTAAISILALKWQALRPYCPFRKP